LHLPKEICDTIASELDFKDFANLRLVNRAFGHGLTEKIGKSVKDLDITNDEEGIKEIEEVATWSIAPFIS
jgi:CO dehydrogenase/acetyl-CoA synthase beta subunit